MYNQALKIKNPSSCDTLLEQLDNHPLYQAIDNKIKLRTFMEHHVFAVWDFMSLIKALQQHVAPVTIPWTPPKSPRFANFINQLVLEEESDDSLNSDGIPLSHFESYVNAMHEIGANTSPINEFVSAVNEIGLEAAKNNKNIPLPAKKFMQFTFEIITLNQPHLLATVLAYGRETLVPRLFRSIQQNIQISALEASNFYAYMDRHIQLDEQEHGPIVARMAEDLCGDSIHKRNESITVTQQALATRLLFWDEIYHALDADFKATKGH